MSAPILQRRRPLDLEGYTSAKLDGWATFHVRTTNDRHYGDASPVQGMMRLVDLPERSFIRRFRQSTGLSPLEYVHRLRIEEAKQMLETGNEPIEVIAAEVGYRDARFLDRLFRRYVGLTPAQYRRKFGKLREMIGQSPLARQPMDTSLPRRRTPAGLGRRGR